MGTVRKKSGLPVHLLTRGAIYTALCVALLSLSYFFESLDMAAALLASVFVYIARLEHGATFSFTIYLATSILGFLLMSLNTGVVFFALAYGWFPLLYAITALKIRKPWFARFLTGLAFTAGFSFVVILFLNVFVSEMDMTDYISGICEFFSLDATPIIEKFSAPFILGLSTGESVMFLGYALFAFLFSLLLYTFFNKFTLFYVYKIRPRLEKAGVVKNDTKNK